MAFHCTNLGSGLSLAVTDHADNELYYCNRLEIKNLVCNLARGLWFVLVCDLMILFLVVRQHQQECVCEDNYVQDHEDGSPISSCLLPVGSDSVQFGDDHSGKDIHVHSVRVGCS